MNVFEAVKQSVTTRQAAEFYGIWVSRSGMAVCPFHNDKNPSMKVDKRFHCFGCGADGDVIDFAALLHGIRKYEAAVKLAEDFGISYDQRGHGPPEKTSPVQRRSVCEKLRILQAEQHCFQVLADYSHLLRQWREEYAPKSETEQLHPLFGEALQKQSYVEYLLDTLLSGTAEEKAKLLSEQGKKVKELEQRITAFRSSAPAVGHECARS